MKRAGVKWLVTGAISLPGLLMLYSFAFTGALAMDLLEPSGEMSARMMILAMLPGPLVEAFGSNRFFRTWLSVRRQLGIAACCYALLHLLFYAVDMSLPAMLDDFGLPSIWTGWLALALLIPPAAISFDAAVRALGRRWKRIQQMVYLSFAVMLAHWLLLAWEWQSAALHALPLILAWLLRLRQRWSIVRYGRAA